MFVSKIWRRFFYGNEALNWREIFPTPQFCQFWWPDNIEKVSFDKDSKVHEFAAVTSIFRPKSPP